MSLSPLSLYLFVLYKLAQLWFLPHLSSSALMPPPLTPFLSEHTVSRGSHPVETSSSRFVLVSELFRHMSKKPTWFLLSVLISF